MQVITPSFRSFGVSSITAALILLLFLTAPKHQRAENAADTEGQRQFGFQQV